MKNLTNEQKAERLEALNEVRHEMELTRKAAMLAPESEYKEGFKKAMTNMFAIINEAIENTSKDSNDSPY